MKTISELKQEREESYSKLMKDLGVFFAFSIEQFNENKTPLKEGEKYVHMGAGTYIPKGNIKQWINGMEGINKAFDDAVNESKELRYQHIAYELANHEAYYTGDITDTLEELGEGYTYNDVYSVYRKELKNRQD